MKTTVGITFFATLLRATRDRDQSRDALGFKQRFDVGIGLVSVSTSRGMLGLFMAGAVARVTQYFTVP